MMKIIELPREAFQAYPEFIPTETKVAYINSLLKVGFEIVEVGSIVSPKLVPQVSDTMEVIGKLDLTGNRSGLMVLLVNKRGALQISEVDEINYVSYPFTISENFAKLNLNSTVDGCLHTVEDILNISLQSKKTFVVYISMAFGNNYGEEWNEDILFRWIGILKRMGIRIILLSNVSIEIEPKLIGEVFSKVNSLFPDMEFGLHLHTGGPGWYEKVDAAYMSGCRRFDGVINGIGGCPMTGKDLLSNLAMENLIRFLQNKNEIPEGFDISKFIDTGRLASDIFRDPDTPG
jgi:hydroxymethylglutaryl-CoA lyase